MAVVVPDMAAVVVVSDMAAVAAACRSGTGRSAAWRNWVDTLAAGLGMGTGTDKDMGMDMGMGMGMDMGMGLAFCTVLARWAEAEAVVVVFSPSLAGAQSQFWLRNIRPCTGACSRGLWRRRSQK